MRRYIGTTDESLCSKGIEELKKNLSEGIYKWGKNIKMYSSPYRRCMETAEIIFGNRDISVENDLRECDFGRFENKNYKELSGDMEYQAWIDSNGKMAFPGGEDITEFKDRCVRAFLKIVEKERETDIESDIETDIETDIDKLICLVVHGGTIMSIMEKFDREQRNYYDYGVNNGHGYVVEFDGTGINILEKF